MSEWRPEGWENPYDDGSCDCRQGAEGTAYEAGADAILAALKAGHPCHVDAEGISINFPKGYIKGSFVFIPDAPREELALKGGPDG